MLLIYYNYLNFCLHLNRRQTYNKLRRIPFWMTKLILVNTTFMNLGDMALLCMTFWTLCSKSTISCARKLKVSKANGIKTCWLSKHTFSCLTTLLDATFRAACPSVKDPTPNPRSGETPVKSTHTCFSPTHPHAWVFIFYLVGQSGSSHAPPSSLILLPVWIYQKIHP